MLAPTLLEIEDPNELSESPDVIMPKLDGCFGYWDTARKTYVSKRGNDYHNPPEFNLELPPYLGDATLVGELLTSNNFQSTTRTIRKQDRTLPWNDTTFNVFDLRGHDGSSFRERRILLDTLFRDVSFTQRHPFVRKVRTFPYDVSTARSLFNECVERNLEGLVLRRLDSKWNDSVHGWKWKVVRDMEGTIQSYEGGKGRLRGILGAYNVRTTSGHFISVGSGLTDEQRKVPLPIGTTITFRYRGVSDEGTPLKPTFKGIFVP